MDESKMPERWKCGNEFLPYQPQASHVNPDHRDGWNQCFKEAAERIAALEADAQRSLEERLQMAVDQSRMEQEVAGLRADAGRYRWLRESTGNPAYAAFSGQFGVGHMRGRYLDAAIDTALNGGATS